MHRLMSSVWFLLVALVVIWGMTWPIMKMGLIWIDPLWFTVVRLLIALFSLIVLLLFLGRFKLPHKEDMPIVLGVGILQFACLTSLVNLGLAEVSAGRAALLSYTSPLWVTPGAHFFLKEQVSSKIMVGVAVGVCGLLVLFNPFGFDWSDQTVVKGNVLLLLAALCWALSILHVRKHQWKGSALELAPWQIAVALLIVIPLAYWSETRPTVWSNELLVIVLYCGILTTAFGQWASIRVAQILPAVTVSLGFLMIPLAGILFSALWLGETLTLTLGVGTLLITLGLLLQIKRRV
ncbi:MAG: EamA/RhaT family transporter [Gammaproteobacteria bacterium]|nr:MAG: EamA/RhaT family transporter [Gammaproteobacteria bacterium]